MPDTVRQQFVSTAGRVRAAMEARNKRVAAKPASVGVALETIAEKEAALSENEAALAEQALCKRLHYTVSSAILGYYSDDREELQRLVDGVPPEIPTVLDAVVCMLSTKKAF